MADGIADGPDAVADLDHDEADLASATLPLRGVNVLVTLSVCGPGIDVRDDRILLRRIEVERLVHHAVEVGDAVVGLDRERLRDT